MFVVIHDTHESSPTNDPLSSVIPIAALQYHYNTTVQ